PSGTVSVGAFSPALIPVTISLPPGMGPGDRVCIRLVLTSTDGSLQLICDGKLCRMGHAAAFCAQASPPAALLTNLEPATLRFQLSGNGSSSTVLDRKSVV